MNVQGQWQRVAGLAAVILALAAGHHAVAQPGVQSLTRGNKGPINIQSDSLELRDKDRTATFINNVRLVQDDTVIECKVLVVHYEDSPDTKGKSGGRAAAPQLSQGEQRISRVEAKGGVVVTQKDQTATGDQGVYDLKANTLVLTGDVVLTQGQNVVRGDRLWVDLTTNVSRVESKKAGPSRVQGLFLPKAEESKSNGGGPANGARGNTGSDKDRQKPTSARPGRTD